MKKSRPHNQQSSPRKANFSTANSAQEQCILAALQEGSANTTELRERFEIMHPAARVQSLREQGHDIRTIRETVIDREGRSHHGVARYVLIALAEVAP